MAQYHHDKARTRQENTLLTETLDTGTGLSPRDGRGTAAALGHGRFPYGSVGSEVQGPKRHFSTATTRTVQGIHYHAPMAYLFPKPLGSTGLLLPSQEPRARGPGLQNVPCTNTQQAGRAKSYRGVCGRVEAGIPTASEAGREPYSSSSSPGKEDTLRIPHQTKQRDSPPPVPAPPLLVSAAPRALRKPGAAARMEEEEEGEGGGGGGRAATASPAASARFVRCLYAVGFLVSGGPGACGGRPRPGTGSGSSAGQGCRGASLQRPLGNARACGAGGVQRLGSLTAANSHAVRHTGRIFIL